MSSQLPPTEQNQVQEKEGLDMRDPRPRYSGPKLTLQKRGEGSYSASTAFWHREHQESLEVLRQILQEIRDLKQVVASCSDRIVCGSKACVSCVSNRLIV